MITHTLNQTLLPFTVDHVEIRTFFQIKDVVGECLPQQLHNLPPEIRPLITSISANAKPSHKHYTTPNNQTPKYDPRIPTRIIHVDGFGVVQLHASKDPEHGWIVHSINFNPGKLIYGHNGRILTEAEFLLALSILIELVKPLLHEPDDWIHIVPGLHVNSRASCNSIEIPFHVIDADGEILKAFSDAKHRDIDLPLIYKCQNQGICFSNSVGDLIIRIYRKDIEMKKKRRQNVKGPQPVLRIEVRLEGEKLKKYFHAGEWRPIEGTSRLVSFRPVPIQQAYFEVIAEFAGCYYRVPAADGADSNDKVGRMAGWVAKQTGLSIKDQFDYYQKRFLGGNKKESVSNAKSTFHIAARDEQSLLSPVKLEELFSEAAWLSQPVIEVPELEAMTRARHRGIGINPLVADVYGSNQPSNPKPWTPHISEHDL